MSELYWRLTVTQELDKSLRLAPANVRSHYQRMLLDWTVLSLSKTSAPPASLESPAAKKRKLNSGRTSASSSIANHHGKLCVKNVMESALVL